MSKTLDEIAMAAAERTCINPNSRGRGDNTFIFDATHVMQFVEYLLKDLSKQKPVGEVDSARHNRVRFYSMCGYLAPGTLLFAAPVMQELQEYPYAWIVTKSFSDGSEITKTHLKFNDAIKDELTADSRVSLRREPVYKRRTK